MFENIMLNDYVCPIKKGISFFIYSRIYIKNKKVKRKRKFIHDSHFSCYIHAQVMRAPTHYIISKWKKNLDKTAEKVCNKIRYWRGCNRPRSLTDSSMIIKEFNNRNFSQSLYSTVRSVDHLKLWILKKCIISCSFYSNGNSEWIQWAFELPLGGKSSWANWESFFESEEIRISKVRRALQSEAKHSLGTA